MQAQRMWRLVGLKVSSALKLKIEVIQMADVVFTVVLCGTSVCFFVTYQLDLIVLVGKLRINYISFYSAFYPENTNFLQGKDTIIIICFVSLAGRMVYLYSKSDLMLGFGIF